MLGCEQFQLLYKNHLKINKERNLPRNLTVLIGRYFERLKSTFDTPQRKFYEALLIRKHKPCLNQKLDSRQLDIDL